MDQAVETTVGRVEAVVARIRAEGGKTTPVAIGDRLVDAGMTSMDMVSLMLAIEAEFDVTIPPSDITPANFRSIATIVAMMDRIGAA
ncbi:phosphopantetheine-binding protein [Lichenihabitans sp. PAMC28606]|uniref:phosphopantetheine-binding protein n=1 Tax=Lichenihabitans sp. PAMC28606 TaxID=2880932 RepID=UPI001D0A0DB8|nr:phosphopantetheine-binding protein [Lichenihabitans sp. PAMC28606]UDL94113.1 phosphopantetheine-binding protein [Lichenihabitans sp. PAMC28606]